jgi:catalase
MLLSFMPDYSFRHNANLIYSYFNSNAEGYNALMTLFSDVGTPWSYRYANIFGINTYKFTKPVRA